MIIAAIFLGLACAQDSIGSVSSPVVVKTSLGPIMGFTDNKVESFLGVPYAIPPIGQFRFAPTQPIAVAWGPQPLNATQYGPACMQDNETWVGRNMSEDCLTLNIWRPAGSLSQMAPAHGGFPIMVWVHGGGNIQGSGSDPQFKADLLASHGVMVVTMNYRLGIFGSYASDEQLSTYGSTGGGNSFLDQITALKWVSKFARAFGGNPQAVTIFGESNGANSICSLVVSPLTVGYFNRMIMQSGEHNHVAIAACYCLCYTRELANIFNFKGDCTTVWGPFEQERGVVLSKTYLRRLGLQGSSLQQLRQLNAADLMKNITKLETSSLMPSVDGAILPQDPADLWKAGNVSLPSDGTAAVLLGGNSEDGVLEYPLRYQGPSYPAYPTDVQSFIKTYKSYFYNTTMVNLISELYNASSNATLASILVAADAAVHCPNLQLMKILNDKGVPSFLYYFSVNRARPGFAIHGAEVPSVFGRVVPPTFLPGYGNVYDVNFNSNVSSKMQQFWANFAKSGNPVTDIAWPSYYSSATPKAMYFRDTSVHAQAVDSSQLSRCAFWDEYLQVHGQIGKGNLVLAAGLLPPLFSA